MISPVRFDRDGVGGAQLLFLLCPGADGKPIQSTREVTRYVQARHQWFLGEQSGSPTADDFIDQIAAARADAAIPFFTYQALSAPTAEGGAGVGPSYKMQFDLNAPLGEEYLAGHRYLTVSLYQAVA